MSRKKEMPFAYSSVSALYYDTTKKVRGTKLKLESLKADPDRFKKALLEFGEVVE